MRNGMAWLVCVLVFAVGGLATWSLTRGQSPAVPAGPPGPAAAAPAQPESGVAPPSNGDPPPLVPANFGQPVDSPGGGLTLRAQIDNSFRRGAEWLDRMNTATGRFVPGFLPAVNAVMEGNNYLHQAGAALALARAARYTGDKTYAARATHAILSLLDDTVAEPDAGESGKRVRHTLPPSTALNRLGAAGLLIAAINELPAPQDDLLARSEELCTYVRRQQQADGSLSWTDGDDAAAAAAADPDADLYPGMALYGLLRSQAHRPAAWKIDVARKARGYYAPWWQEHKSLAVVPWQTAAYAEAYLLTHEKPFADSVVAMNDWLCEKQHDRLDPRHPEWLGGFAVGKTPAPDISSAACAESLAEACRVAREAADLPRHRRYTAALELCLQFLASLQYSDANTQHFAPLYRQRLLIGGFHGSHQDGDLRLDYTQHAVSAMAQYLTATAQGGSKPESDPRSP